MPIDEITGEKSCVKKTAKCRLCQAIYTLWRKEKMRGKYQSGPSWTGVVRHLESMRNVRTEEEAKQAMARQRSRVRRDTTVVNSIEQYTKPWGPNVVYSHLDGGCVARPYAPRLWGPVPTSLRKAKRHEGN